MSKDRGEALIAHSDTELLAAHTLKEASFSAQATSRAYYAAFYAAEAALLSLGETRSKHSGGTVSLWLGPQARSVSKGVSVYIEL